MTAADSACRVQDGCQMSAHQRPDELPRFPDHRTGSVDGETRNRNAQSTRRVQTSRGAMCHGRSIPHPAFRVVSFHLEPFAFCGCPRAERRGAEPITAALCVMVVSVLPLGSVPEQAMAAMPCPLQRCGAQPLSRRLAQTRGGCSGPVCPLWAKCLGARQC